jgi:hypothetical protein
MPWAALSNTAQGRRLDLERSHASAGAQRYTLWIGWAARPRGREGVKVAVALSRVLQQRTAPQAITVDNGGEFVSRAMDAWAYAHEVRLDFIRPGKPVENAFIESSMASSATNA